MVRVLQAYNFHKQKTLAINGDILAASLIDDNKVAISSAEQFIEIYTIGDNDEKEQLDGVSGTKNDVTIANGLDVKDINNTESGSMKYTLATVGEVVNLVYCEAGKYLLTLEKETVGSPVNSNSTGLSCTSSNNSSITIAEDDIKLFVRIYTNFLRFPEAKLVDLPITIRIASMTTPKAAVVESIDVIELPLRSPPDLIQCCQISGNVIVSSKERIYLYELTQCTHETTQPRFTYIDFLPFKFFVNLNFVPQKLCLAENVIACMNSRYCVAFKIVDIPSGCSTRDSNPLRNDYEAAENGEEGAVGIDTDPTSSSSASVASKASAGPSSYNSFESDSLATTCSRVGLSGFPGRTPIDFNVARIVNSACGREFEVDLKSQWEQNDASNNTYCDAEEIVINPARASEIKIKLVNEAKAMNVSRITSHGNITSPHCAEDTSVQYDIKKLLQICIKTAQPNSRVIEIFRCMDLKALYQRTSGDGDESNNENPTNQQTFSAPLNSYQKHLCRRTLRSNKHEHCVGYSLLVATSVDGYLYQFCAQGKWYNENEKPIALYSFTAPVLKVHIDDYVIYAITTESVELHTSRIGHKLFNNRFEYPSINSIFPEESSPDVNATVAVIGLFSFLNIQFVSINRKNLVLISNSAAGLSATTNCSQDVSTTQKRRSGIAARLLAEAKAKHQQFRSGNSSVQASAQNEWTLYNLVVPNVSTIVKDLEMLAETFRTASSSNFYDLMEEAHVMLRLSLSLEFAKLTAEQEQKLRVRFIENCHKLADFSLRSKKKEVYLQATGFYKMCNLQLPDIYTNFISNHLTSKEDEYESSTECDGFQGDKESLIGLIYTVKLFLINVGTNRQKAGFLHQLVKPYFTRNKPQQLSQQQQQRLPHVPLALEFLNMFILCSPADIPQFMLNSPIVADIVSAELITYLIDKKSRSPEENLLLAFCACRMSNYMLSQQVISKTCRRDLAIALIKHKNVLFDDGTRLYQRPLDTISTKCSTSHRSQNVTSRRNAPKSSRLSRNNSYQPTASFSDFTETILLATENEELIEAISDAFIHALCIENSVCLEMLIQLFLNYIATHIGQKGYQTSQKVFANVLQVYYYDLFDVNPLVSNDMHSNTPPPPTGHHQEENEEDETSSNALSLHGGSEYDNESISSEASSSIEDHRHHRVGSKINRIAFEQLEEGQKRFERNSSISLSLEQINESETNLKGLKILFRMYLGRLKVLSDIAADAKERNVDSRAESEEFLQLRLECIRFLGRHLQELRMQEQSRVGGGSKFSTNRYYSKNICDPNNRRQGNRSEQKLIFVPLIPDYKADDKDPSLANFIRPIPCLNDRPQYLNRLPPFQRSDFSYPGNEDGVKEVRFVGWHNELLTLTLKIQSLLSTPKIDREIIEEFVAFIQKTPHLLGIDSFLVIILPKNLAINYMLNFCPEYIWQYGKSNNFTPKHWESLLRKILSKQAILPNWKTYVTDILNNLVAELTFEELLQCFPNEVLGNRNAEPTPKVSDNRRCVYEQEQQPLLYDMMQQSNSIDGYPARNHLAMDNIDENNVFEVVLRKAVSKQRSLALRSMIESTGAQLFEATSNPMYNLN